MDRRDMKIQALLERIAELTTMYENVNADNRVIITELTQQRDALLEKVDELGGIEDVEAPDASTAD